MAPTVATEDYYAVLQVSETASHEEIVKAYRGLAFTLHPDRNKAMNATQAFQLLGQAYDTLKDTYSRATYDVQYPSIKRARGDFKGAQPPHKKAAEPAKKRVDEAEQIAALVKAKRERGERWSVRKNALNATIYMLQADVKKLALDIVNLNSFAAAEAAEEAQKNSWGMWFLSPFYKNRVVSEEETLRKDRAKQERRIEKDLKERRLTRKEEELVRHERSLEIATEQACRADREDDEKIRVLNGRKQARERKEREEKDRLEREIQAEFWWKQRQEG